MNAHELPSSPLSSDNGSSTGSEESGKKSKSRKGNKTRRPPNSFLLYANDRRAILRLEFPEQSNGQISKMIAAEWKTLDAGTKKEYQEKSSAGWKKFMQENPNYCRNYTPKAKKRKRCEQVIETPSLDQHYHRPPNHRHHSSFSTLDAMNGLLQIHEAASRCDDYQSYHRSLSSPSSSNSLLSSPPSSVISSPSSSNHGFSSPRSSGSSGLDLRSASPPRAFSAHNFSRAVDSTYDSLSSRSGRDRRSPPRSSSSLSSGQFLGVQRRLESPHQSTHETVLRPTEQHGLDDGRWVKRRKSFVISRAATPPPPMTMPSQLSTPLMRSSVRRDDNTVHKLPSFGSLMAAIHPNEELGAPAQVPHVGWSAA